MKSPLPASFLRPTAPSLMAGLLFSLTTGVAQTSAATAPETYQLNPFEVRAESVAGYGVSSVATVTRLKTPLKDIPQTISVVTSEFLAEIGAANFDEAIAYTPGITNRANVADGYTMRGFSVFNRYVNGYKIAPSTGVNRDPLSTDRIEIIKGPSSAVTGRGDIGGLVNTITKKPVFDHAGGSVTTKVGTGAYYRAEVDSYGPLQADKLAYRVLAAAENSGGTKGGSDFYKNKRYVFVPSLEWRPTEKTTLSAEVDYEQGWEPSDRDTLLLDGNRTNAPYDPYIFQRNPDGTIIFNAAGNALRKPEYPSPTSSPALRDIVGNPINHYYPADTIGRDEPWSGRAFKLGTAYGTVTHQFSDHLSVRQGLAFERVDRDMEEVTFGAETTLPGNTNVPSQRDLGVTTKVFDPSIPDIQTRRFRAEYVDFTGVRLQGDALWTQDLHWAGRHALLLGYEYGNVRTDTLRYFGGMNAINVLRTKAEVFAANTQKPARNTWRLDGNNQVVERSIGYFAQDSIGLLKNDRLKLLGGLRWDRLVTETIDFVLPANTRIVSGEPTISKRVGLSFDVLPSLTAYATYSDQQDPTTTAQRFVNLSLPGFLTNEQLSETVDSSRQGTLKEVGFKTELFQKRMTATVAFWRIAQQGAIVNVFRNPINPATGLPVSYGENTVSPDDRAEGIEAEVFGNLSDKLAFYGSYQKSNSKSLRLNRNSATGEITSIDVFPLRDILPEKFSAHLRYTLWRKPAREFSVNAGVVYIAKGSLNAAQVYLINPASTRWDVGAFYRQDRWQVRFTVLNLTDELIVSGPQASGGVPRRYQADLTWTW